MGKNKELHRKALGEAIRENLEIKKPHFAPSTYENYRKKSEQLIKRAGKLILEDASATDIEKALNYFLKSCGGKTVNHYIDILRAVFGRAWIDRIIERNPMANVKMCKFVMEEPDPFTQEELRLLRSWRDRYPYEVALIMVAYYTGVRLSELMGLSAEAFNLDTMTVSIDMSLVMGRYKTPKTGSSRRTLSLYEEVQADAIFLVTEAMKRRAKTVKVLQADNRTEKLVTGHFLAYSTDEQRLYRSGDEFRERFFRPYCAELGVRYRAPSTLRHTYASQLMSHGVSVDWIAKQMGHTSSKMVMLHYGKWLADGKQELAAQAEQALRGEAVTRSRPATSVAPARAPAPAPAPVGYGYWGWQNKPLYPTTMGGLVLDKRQ